MSNMNDNNIFTDCNRYKINISAPMPVYSDISEVLEKYFIDYLKKRGYIISKKNEQLETE